MVSMRAEIARTYQVIRPYIRRTPVVDVDAADFGLTAAPLVLKLELMQHTGSFKTRGAFSNLLTRAVPGPWRGGGIRGQSRQNQFVTHAEEVLLAMLVLGRELILLARVRKHSGAFVSASQEPVRLRCRLFSQQRL